MCPCSPQSRQSHSQFLTQYIRPLTVYVSGLFVQIIAYFFGKGMKSLIPVPGPTSTPFIKAKGNKFWHFMNGTLFSALHSCVFVRT